MLATLKYKLRLDLMWTGQMRLLRISDVIKTFFQDQKDQDQDLNFKTKTKISVQDQAQDFASQDEDLFVVYTRGRPKSIFHFRP